MEMTSDDREALCFNLYHARKALAACPAEDFNQRCDIEHRIRHLVEQLGHVDEEAFASFVLRVEEAAAERARLAQERHYERTGVIHHD
jgi:hypothetical protein